MEKLTSQQASNLSNNFLGLAQAVGDFRYNNWNSLSKEENQKLGEYQWSILKYGEDILVISTNLIMNDAQSSLTQINNVTLQIKGTVQKLHNIQKGITVAAAIVTLGDAIIRLNPQSIV